MAIYTAGYEGLSIDAFIARLYGTAVSLLPSFWSVRYLAG